MEEQSGSVTIEPPRITPLIASDGSSIGESSSDTYADVTLKGTAEVLRVEIFYSGDFIAMASVTSGVWTLDVQGLSSGAHIFLPDPTTGGWSPMSGDIP